MKYSLIKQIFLILIVTIVAGSVQAAPDTRSTHSETESSKLSDIDLRVLLRTGAVVDLTGRSQELERRFLLHSANLKLMGSPVERVSYLIDIGTGDESNSGEAYAAFFASELFQIKAGLMRPFISRETQRDPSELIFTERARYSRAMLNPREIGVSIYGETRFLRYNVGVFNGTGGHENDMRFLYAARVATRFQMAATEVRFGGVGSLNMSERVEVGNTGLLSDGMQSLFGGYFEIEHPKFYLGSEYLQSRFRALNIGNRRELIQGLNVTTTANLTKRNQLLLRFDYLDYELIDRISEKIVVGWNVHLFPILYVQLNFSAQFDSDRDDSFRLGFLTQLSF